ncbi:hypothetical protein RND71_013227 [Anisodus tanguticus]|uniref:MADS-box domain-containing protein n=1 Tax=Anisodus tanguticus TaxID=243964 RepID=A0AAE1SG41_9SOLA|nr:hypothetical protein RND71_013227 [Anisodus tanguticus]
MFQVDQLLNYYQEMELPCRSIYCHMGKDGKKRHAANWLDSSAQMPEKMLALVANNSGVMPHDDIYSTLVMKKIENSTSRQLTYSKRKDSIVKKANELAVLCDTDVALLMFSPTGQVTSYSSRGSMKYDFLWLYSVEDIMLRIVNRSGELNMRPIPNEEVLSFTHLLLIASLCRQVFRVSSDLNKPYSLQQLTQRLTQSKYEGEMVEKIAIAEAHEEKLNELKQRLSEAREKLRLRSSSLSLSFLYYEPQVENINSVHQAVACQQYLTSALERIQQSKAKLLGGDEFIKRNENVEVAASVNTEDTAAAGNGSAYSNP